MNQIVKSRSLALAIFAVTLIAFPGVAAANLSIYEPVEEIDLGKEVIGLEEPQIVADEYPATVSGERFANGPVQGELTVLDSEDVTVTCDAVDIDGGTLTEASTHLDLAVEYSEGLDDQDCTAEVEAGTFDTSVQMHSCGIELSDLQPIEESQSSISGAIACTEEAGFIEIRIALCGISIPAQALNASSELANTAEEGDQKLGAGVVGSELTYVVKNPVYCGYVGLAAGTYEDGSMRTEFEVDNLSIYEPVEEIDLGKEVIGLEAPQIVADEYPAAVSGERFANGPLQGELTVLDSEDVTVTCDAVDVDGGSLAEATTQLNLDVEYSEAIDDLDCTTEVEAGTFDTSVQMHSCGVELSDLQPIEENQSSISGAIACTEEAGFIEIRLGAICGIQIPAQALNASSELANTAEEGEQKLGAGVVGSELTYVVKNPVYCGYVGLAAGTYEDGSMRTEFELGA